jgi:exonuclease III
MANMCITSLNVRGINEISKRNTVYTWIKENKYDICFLQETYCTEAVKTQFDKHWKGDAIHSVSNSSHSRGVSILLSSNLNYKLINSHTDNDGRMVLVNLEIDENEYTLVNICT